MRTQNDHYSSIAELLETRCQINPNAIAIRDIQHRSLTYHQLYHCTQNVVAKLNYLGIGANDRVAIVLPNGAEMAVAFLAVASGAICTPLNPAYREPEFEFYLTDLNAKALIIQKDMDSPALTVANKQGISILELCSSESLGELTLTSREVGFPSNTEFNFSTAEDIALILHTSGTTSRPKIVPLTHGNLCTSAHNISNSLALGEKDTALNIMPLFHIHGLIGVLLSSMAAGGTVVCTPGFDCEQIWHWMGALQPTWYSAVPTMHQAILTKLETNPLFQSSLRFIRSSSAALPSQVMAGLEQAFKASVIEAYGMTEASHQMTSNPLPPGKRKPDSVGLPAGPEVAIMDEEGNLLSQGNIGEVVIKGANVTQGYENNPEANRKAFTQGWFRTGDQGYLDQDGYLFLKGRLKEIISRGAEKISPQEIDMVLRELPGIAQGVTFAIPHPTLGEDVAAAVVLKDNVELSAIAIREFLFERLADFKVPSQIVIVTEIPKGATGKIQRIGLAQKLETQLKQPYILPQSEIELKIAAIFTEVLRKDDISTYDNFFALGGDSLKGTQVVVRLNALFELDLVNTIIFHKPTIAELAPPIQSLLEDSENKQIAELAAALEKMSPEEVKQLLENLDER